MLLNPNEVYVFNPAYVMKNDLCRVVLYSSLKHNKLSVKDWESFLHPLHAKIFSFFTFNRPLSRTISLLSEYLRRDIQATRKIIYPFIENPLSVYTKYKDDKVLIPKNVIINRKKINDKVDFMNLHPNLFDCGAIDLNTRRMYTSPLLLTFMLNNRCLTNCVYCYADTKTKINKPLSTSRILQLIDEAKEMQVRAVNLMGGEVFLHPDWSVILTKLTDLDIAPEYISTKLPINNKIIDLIRETGLKNPIQISLDTCSADILQATWSVKRDYLQQVLDGIKLLDNSGLQYRINSVLTAYNTSNEQFKELFNFISGLENIADWRITPAVNSSWIEDDKFQKIKSNKKEIETLYKFIEKEIIPYSRFPIFLNHPAINREFNYCTTGSGDFKGVRCSALNNHLFILPDGQATICEQLYWHPQFLVGNVSTNSISEVWNSDAAKSILNLKRDDIQKDSPCKECRLYETCFSMNNRCWVDIIKAYGKENWDYPDPRCVHAPPFKFNIEF